MVISILRGINETCVTNSEDTTHMLAVVFGVSAAWFICMLASHVQIWVWLLCASDLCIKLKYDTILKDCFMTFLLFACRDRWWPLDLLFIEMPSYVEVFPQDSLVTVMFYSSCWWHYNLTSNKENVVTDTSLLRFKSCSSLYYWLK